jgi:hypothetical protein
VLVAVSNPVLERLQGVRDREDGFLLDVPEDPVDDLETLM